MTREQIIHESGVNSMVWVRIVCLNLVGLNLHGSIELHLANPDFITLEIFSKILEQIWRAMLFGLICTALAAPVEVTRAVS